MKIYQDVSVYDASIDRINYIFDNFNKIYVSFSGGKDSTTMLHLLSIEARKRNRKIGCLIVDLEGQYDLTVKHIEKMIDDYSDCLDVYWCCLQISLRNAVSVYQPRWVCWDREKKEEWIRDMPKIAKKDEDFPFFSKGMEFEEFVPEFGEWYSEGEKCACFVGIRADESLNRFRTISSKSKIKFNDKIYTTKVTDNVFNIYPIYDWKTKDIWRHSAKTGLSQNPIYQRMYLAKVPLSHMRICQPYGDDQRRGLWLFHILEPQTWPKVVRRVSGANSGALYVQETGNINGYNKISKPSKMTWKEYAEFLLCTLPKNTKKHYLKRFRVFIDWWLSRDYENIPDEAPHELESERIVPSYRRICKCILRNDWWCKGLSFTQPKSEAYSKFLDIKKKKNREVK